MPSTTRRHRPSDYLATVVESFIVIASAAYVVTGSVTVLVVWESIATLYLLVSFFLSRTRSLAGRKEPGRTGVLATLSWVLPFAASLVGITAAIQVLVVRGLKDPAQGQGTALALAASLAIILSWHLLHTGFAQIYVSSWDRNPKEPGLVFATERAPTFADFLYFSFTIGTSFATSDVTVSTSRMLWTVLIHSIASFFYNALVVAVAFQVLQQLVET